jgi:hypothetical protein
MSGIQMMLLSSGSDTEFVTVASWSSGYDSNFGFNVFFGGSIIDGLLGPCGGVPITALQVGGLGAFNIVLAVTGEVGNSGFNNVTITNSTGGVTGLERNSATFSSGSGVSNWFWSGAAIGAFGNAGTVATVVFS